MVVERIAKAKCDPLAPSSCDRKASVACMSAVPFQHNRASSNLCGGSIAGTAIDTDWHSCASHSIICHPTLSVCVCV